MIDGTRLQDTKFAHNKCFLYLYGDLSTAGSRKLVKLVRMNTVRNAGLVIDDDESEDGKKHRDVNDEKLENNIARARNKIFELAFCNHWDYFITATLDGTKYDRTNLEVFHKDITQWLRDQSKKLNTKISFLLIPELHSDGKTWHMHGFIAGLPYEQLKRFKVGDRMGKGIANKVLSGDTVYNWPAYQKKFGFCDLEPIKNHEAVSKYVTKYISKSLANSVSELHAHLYYHSRGLKEAFEIERGPLICPIDSSPVSSFNGEHCSIEWYDISALTDLLNAFGISEYSTVSDFIKDECR